MADKTMEIEKKSRARQESKRRGPKQAHIPEILQDFDRDGAQSNPDDSLADPHRIEQNIAEEDHAFDDFKLIEQQQSLLKDEPDDLLDQLDPTPPE